MPLAKVQVISCFFSYSKKKGKNKNGSNDKPKQLDINNDGQKLPAHDPAGSHKQEMKIDPSVFVSLKKGSISSNYKIGEVLGEGKKLCFLII